MYTNILKVLCFITAFYLCSCSNDIDKKVEDDFNANDSLIDISKLYPEKWDTMFYITNACSYLTIVKRIGPLYEGLWQDVGDKILIMNDKEKRIVYYKEWDPNYGQSPKGIIFVFRNNADIIAIPRNKAKFHIKQNDGIYYLTLAK